MYNMSPSRTCIEEITLDLAAEAVVLASHDMIRAKEVSLACDKADEKKGYGGCTKLVSWFDENATSEEFPDGRTRNIILDADKSGNTSKEVAKAIRYSLEKYDIYNKVSCYFVGSDSGGGGTGESLGTCLKEEKVLDREGGHVGSCTMHNTNLEMGVPMKHVFVGMAAPTSDVKKIPRNALQMIYSAWAWESLKTWRITHCSLTKMATKMQRASWTTLTYLTISLSQ